MTGWVKPLKPYTSRIIGEDTGLVGTIRFRLLDNDTTVDDPVYGPSTASIVEDPTGSGSYVFNGTSPETESVYSRLWDVGDDVLIADEDLAVSNNSPFDIAALRAPLRGFSLFGRPVQVRPNHG